jgi:hypothetical protein
MVPWVRLVIQDNKEPLAKMVPGGNKVYLVSKVILVPRVNVVTPVLAEQLVQLDKGECLV